MQSDSLEIIIEAEKTRRELIEVFTTWMVNTNSVYNKHALRRGRSDARKYTILARKFAKLSTEISFMKAADLLEMREIVQQKITSK